MLDENLPTFHFKPSSDNALNTVLYFTQRGDEPQAEYLLRRADPAQPVSRNKYAVALANPWSPDIVYAECVVSPEWTQPSLSAAELRSQAQNPAAVPVTPNVPETVTLQLYNPDQVIAIKLVPGSWNKAESWEFEMPMQSFKTPSRSEIDRQHGSASAPVGDVVPKIMFRWRKDGRLSKDMTCYLTGHSMGEGRKSKEPDITVALFKNGPRDRDAGVALTVYEPNLQRVEVEDRKGLEIALVLGAEVIRDLWVTPRHDLFNLSGDSAAAAAAAPRKNSRPNAGPTPALPAAAAGPVPAMSGANMAAVPPHAAAYAQGPPRPPAGPPPAAAASAAAAIPPAANSAAIDAETRRLQALMEQEQRDREREDKERERRDRAEQKRIKKMLEEEEKERARREAAIAKETERLRKQYGTKGQQLPSTPGAAPPLPQRPVQQPPPPQQLLLPQGGAGRGGGGWWGQQHAPPPRPISAGPMPGQQAYATAPPPLAGPFNSQMLNSWWGGPSAPVASGALPANLRPPPHGGGPGGGSGSGRQRIQKKRSMQW